MQYDQFVHDVQHRACLASGGEAVRAIHATLATLGERLFNGEAERLAAQLPPEICCYLLEPDNNMKLDMDEFLDRISEREGIDGRRSMHHARVVLSVLREAVSRGEAEDVLAQLPADIKWMLEPGYSECVS
jgi:uncharacterized protein (DUF2267 family)